MHAGDDAKHGGGRRADEDRELGRQAPDLGGIGAKIARPAEIERMAERNEPDIADQKIEGAGEQRKAQRLHEKDRIKHERRRDEKQRPSPRAATPALQAVSRRTCIDRGIGRARHHALRPNMPAGRISSTIDHDDEDHRVRRFRKKHLGQALDDAEREAGHNRAHDRTHAADHHDREHDDDEVGAHLRRDIVDRRRHDAGQAPQARRRSRR